MKLKDVVSGLAGLVEDKKAKFLEFADYFEERVEDNLVKNAFQLAEETLTDWSEWNEFFAIPEVNGWINEAMRAIAAAGQRKSLQKISGSEKATVNDVNAYKALEQYTKGAKQVDNSNVVIMYLPVPDGGIDGDNE